MRIALITMLTLGIVSYPGEAQAPIRSIPYKTKKEEVITEKEIKDPFQRELDILKLQLLKILTIPHYHQKMEGIQ